MDPKLSILSIYGAINVNCTDRYLMHISLIIHTACFHALTLQLVAYVQPETRNQIHAVVQVLRGGGRRKEME